MSKREMSCRYWLVSLRCAMAGGVFWGLLGQEFAAVVVSRRLSRGTVTPVTPGPPNDVDVSDRNKAGCLRTRIAKVVHLVKRCLRQTKDKRSPCPIL